MTNARRRGWDRSERDEAEAFSADGHDAHVGQVDGIAGLELLDRNEGMDDRRINRRPAAESSSVQ